MRLDADGEVVLSAKSLSKTFAGRQVLRAVDLDLSVGQIHGLVGQNGSGKSTLVKILSGYHAPDPGGSLRLGGREIELRVGREDKLGLPVRFVHQDLALSDDASILENFAIQRHSTHFGWRIRWKDERRRAEEALNRLGLALDLDLPVGRLTAVERTLVAIMRAVDGLMTEPRGVLVLDEPTSMLGRESSDQVMLLMRRLANHGISVLFISHRIDEILKVADIVTVLRDGRVVASRPTTELCESDLIEILLGFPLGELYPPSPPNAAGQVALEVRDLECSAFRNLNIKLQTGEILGITGLAGMGQEHLPYVLFGIDRTGKGDLQIGSTPVRVEHLTPALAMRLGIALLPANRASHGASGRASVSENLSLPMHRRRSLLGFVRQRDEFAEALSLMEQFDVRPANPRLEFGGLSGGNQQKALLGKWFSTQPSVVLLHEPTQGVDIAAKRQIFRFLHDAAEAGTAMLIVSSEHEDLAHLCTRVLVFRDGAISADLHGSALTYESVMTHCLRGAA